jgi:hypothetical protein
MNRWNRILVATLLGSTLAAQGATAGEAIPQDGRRAPSAEMMILDGLVYRPLSLAGTIIGTGIFVVTLPFSLAGGNADDAGRRLVVEPARDTFTRCLGCIDPLGEEGMRW